MINIPFFCKIRFGHKSFLNLRSLPIPKVDLSRFKTCLSSYTKKKRGFAGDISTWGRCKSPRASPHSNLACSWRKGSRHNILWFLRRRARQVSSLVISIPVCLALSIAPSSKGPSVPKTTAEKCGFTTRIPNFFSCFSIFFQHFRQSTSLF